MSSHSPWRSFQAYSFLGSSSSSWSLRNPSSRISDETCTIAPLSGCQDQGDLVVRGLRRIPPLEPFLGSECDAFGGLPRVRACGCRKPGQERCEGHVVDGDRQQEPHAVSSRRPGYYLNGQPVVAEPLLHVPHVLRRLPAELDLDPCLLHFAQASRVRWPSAPPAGMLQGVGSSPSGRCTIVG
jgi:hypothetical protein